MSYTSFNKKAVNFLEQPLFLGEPVNVSRYDQQRYPVFENLMEKQLSFFWRPEEVDVTKDRIDYNNLTDHEKHIFISNLKYQTLLDSIQGRSPNTILLPLVSVPELESWIEIWSFSEVIHSRSYTHIIRNIVNDPAVVFDDIVVNEHILKRAETISKYYDDVYKMTIDKEYSNIQDPAWMRELKKKIYLCLISINALEAIRFYVSFVCSFAFGERKLMEGNAKIISLIQRDEQLHMVGTQNLINILRRGNDDSEFKEIANECEEEVYDIFRTVVEQEKEWASYLFKDGSMIGLNYKILTSYLEYLTNIRMKAIGLTPLFPDATSNPIPWINNWVSSDNVQVAPQETEITSYLIGQVDSDLNDTDLGDFDL